MYKITNINKVIMKLHFASLDLPSNASLPATSKGYVTEVKFANELGGEVKCSLYLFNDIFRNSDL